MGSDIIKSSSQLYMGVTVAKRLAKAPRRPPEGGAVFLFSGLLAPVALVVAVGLRFPVSYTRWLAACQSLRVAVGPHFPVSYTGTGSGRSFGTVAVGPHFPVSYTADRRPHLGRRSCGWTAFPSQLHFCPSGIRCTSSCGWTAFPSQLHCPRHERPCVLCCGWTAFPSQLHCGQTPPPGQT